MVDLENELTTIRKARKEELANLRGSMGGHVITSRIYQSFPNGAEKESHWLGEDSLRICRHLPLFGPKSRIPMTTNNDIGTNDWHYEGSSIILRHLDNLVSLRNPELSLTRRDLPQDWVLDMGCGRGIALEDIWAYYGPLLNLMLQGNTLHIPAYKSAFEERGIQLLNGGLDEIGQNSAPEGYMLIMASYSLIYYTDYFYFLDFARRHLHPSGIFPVDYGTVTPNTIAIVDKMGQIIADPQGYILEKYEKMGWKKEGDTLIVKYYPTDELRLEYIPEEKARKLPEYVPPKLSPLTALQRSLDGRSLTADDIEKDYFRITS